MVKRRLRLCPGSVDARCALCVVTGDRPHALLYYPCEAGGNNENSPQEANQPDGNTQQQTEKGRYESDRHSLSSMASQLAPFPFTCALYMPVDRPHAGPTTDMATSKTANKKTKKEKSKEEDQQHDHIWWSLCRHVHIQDWNWWPVKPIMF